MSQRVEEAIQEIIDRETRAWDSQDVDLLLSLLHPDMVWPWPPHARAHDPAEWQLILGRYDRERWRRGWGELFDSHELVHNRRRTVKISVSEEGDGAFAVVDVDTLWRHKESGVEDHWLGRACKIYSLVDGGWQMMAQTGLLDYGQANLQNRSLDRVQAQFAFKSLTHRSTLSLARERERVKREIVHAAKDDPRIVGCLDYGSTGQGKGDRFSDLDLAIFVRDEDLQTMVSSWKDWAAQFGEVLLAFHGASNHPWLVYDVSPIPLRVDLIFHPASGAGGIAEWPASPATVESMLLYGAGEGDLSEAVARLVGKSLAPADMEAAFEKVSGALWYYLIRTWSKLQRGQIWAARRDFNMIVLGNLFALLRLEVGATERWTASEASDDLEAVLSQARLDQLEGCVAGPRVAELRSALLRSALISQEVQQNMAAANHWEWPAKLANRVVGLLFHYVEA